MSEPIKTNPNPAGIGRPVISEEQFQIWLDEMRPFLRRGASLHYAMEKCALLTHEWSIREKYRSKDWFSRKVDALRATMGELVNDVVFTVVEGAKNRLIDSETKQLTDNEVKIIKLAAERHRSAQPFFVNRTETAEAKDEDLGKILDNLEATDYEQLGSEAEKQVVATDSPIQGEGQERPAGDLQAEQDAASVHSGEEGTPLQPDPQA